MFRSLWLRNLLDVARSRKDRRRLAARSRKPVRLTLESLEERVTPSGPQTAGSYTDLVNAVKADTIADTNYVIQITNNFAFDSGGQVNISKLGAGSTLTIEGQNGTNYTLTGNGNRLFNIASGQNVTFADLTLTGGTVTSATDLAQGGAINDVGGNVALSAVSIQGDTVTGGLAEGGGIYVSGGGNLTIKNGSVIQSNTAQGASFAAGGGVYVFGDSTVAISDSILSKNSATGGQGANSTSPGANGGNGGTAYGGGLDVNGSGWTVTLTGDTLSGNILLGGNGGNGAAGSNATGTNASGGNGGNGGQGGFATGGGAYFFVSKNGTGHLTILNDPSAPTTNPSQFLDNSIQSGVGGKGGDGGTSTGTANNANGGNGGVANQAVGGALFMSSAAGGTVTATISNTTISGNKVFGAKGGAGGAAGTGGSGSAGVAGTNSGGSFAEGGGIVLENGVTATINNSTVAENTATASSGVDDSAKGGGICDFGRSLTLSKVTVQGNSATGTAAQGGGVSMPSGDGSLIIQGGSVIQSNRATGVSASGGGIYVLSPNTVSTTIALRDSILSNNSAQGQPGADGTAPGKNGGDGGTASGGGLFVVGYDWTTTLTGVTLSRNSVVGGNGGNGAAGSNATAANASGDNGGNGGNGGGATGGAACLNGDSSCRLTILDDPSAPDANPSIMINNTVQSGTGGNGGAGGASTGTAENSNGGAGGFAEGAMDGALSLLGSTVTNIGNSTFYGNKVLGENPGVGGAAGTGGSGTAGNAGANPGSYLSSGGGLDLGGSTITLVNNTVAKNTVTAGSSDGGTGSRGAAIGGGIIIESFITATFDNNTITQNTISGGVQALGSGVYDSSTGLILVNNLIQGNQSLTLPANDFETSDDNPPNASNNFITSANANAVSITANIVGNNQVQLGDVVGVDSNGKPTGGPIYYPLLSGTVSVGAGTTSVLSTIAAVEGTASANATDEIGNPSSNDGSIDLGAVQVVTSNPFAPVITSSPTSQTVTAGANVSFTVSASGATSVQWQVSTDGGKTFTDLNGATGTTIVLYNVTTAMNGYEYEAVFTNSAGYVTTSAAMLTVNPVPSPPPSPPPAPPVLNVPPLLAFFDSLLGGTETVNANGTETITDSFFGIPLIVSTFDSHGDIVSVTLFGFNITFLFV